MGRIVFVILSSVSLAAPSMGKECNRVIEGSAGEADTSRLYSRDIDRLRKDLNQRDSSYVEEGLQALKEWLEARDRIYGLSTRALLGGQEVKDLSEARDLSMNFRSMIRSNTKLNEAASSAKAEFEEADKAYQKAFNKLLGSFGRYILGLTHRSGGSSEELVDRIQEANMHFLNAALLFDASRAWRHDLSIFQIFLAYLKKHVVMGLRRDRMRNYQAPLAVDVQSWPSSELESPAEDFLERHEAVESFGRRQLPGRHRRASSGRRNPVTFTELWRLREVNDLSARAIGEIYGVSHGTVSNWLKDMERVMGELREIPS